MGATNRDGAKFGPTRYERAYRLNMGLHPGVEYRPGKPSAISMGFPNNALLDFGRDLTKPLFRSFCFIAIELNGGF
jgi:hypothetical protein